MSQLLLLTVIFFPILSGLLGLVLPRVASKPLHFMLTTLLELGLVAGLFGCSAQLTLEPIFLTGTWSFTFATDGLALLMAGTSAVVYILIALLNFGHVQARSAWHYVWLLGVQTALMGLFFTTTALGFYTFWEMAVIPGIFLFYGWGSGNIRQVGMRLVVMSFVGSMAMLAAFVMLFMGGGGISPLLPTFRYLILGGFLLAFVLKTPLVPFHRWQPDTYVQSDPNTSMVYAGLLSKMGVFGLARLILPLFPDFPHWAFLAVMGMGLVSVLYAASVAFAQTDFKRLIAYSSLSHMGLMVMAIFSGTVIGFQGVFFQVVVHAVGTAGLLAIAEIIRRRSGTGSLDGMGGIRAISPVLSGIVFIVILGSIGLPLTGGFVGEFLMLAGLFKSFPWLAVGAGLSLILGAGYMLSAFQKIMLGPVGTALPSRFEFSLSEKSLLGFLALVTFALGIFPQPILQLTTVLAQTILVKGFCPW